MSSFTICPACHYTRQATDDAPEWECPKCQKAYVKTSMAAQQQEFMNSFNHAQDGSGAISDRAHSEPTPNAGGHPGTKGKVKGAPRDIGSNIFLILFFSIFLCGGCYALHDVSARLIRNIHLIRSGTSWTGRVVDYKISSSRSGGITPVVSFTTPNGIPIQFMSLCSKHISGYSMGQSVPILFDPKDPHVAEINERDRLWGGVTVGLILGLIFSTVGGGVILLALRDIFIKKE